MSEPLIIRNGDSYDLDNRNTRKIINEIRARFGAGQTTMTDEQIEAGREVYGAKLDYDMAVFDEVQDTREKLEADVANILRNAASHTSANTSIGDMLRYTVPGSGAAPWQLEEDACEALASIVESQLAELTAECDELRESIKAFELGQMYSLYKKACMDRDEWRSKYEALRYNKEKVWCDCDCCNWRDERERLTDEVETLKRANRIQAESFKKLEIEIGKQ